MKEPVVIDARGLNCPQPVLLTKKSIENSDSDTFLVNVDNQIAKENVMRFLGNLAFHIEVRELAADHYEIEARRGTKSIVPDLSSNRSSEVLPIPESSSLVVYVGTCFMGTGDNDLGAKLIRGFLRTLIDMSFRPWRMIFINSGVKLTTIDEEATEALNLLSEKGVEILSCGTCLQHYGLEDKLSVGRTTTMYEVIESLEQASKVISPN